MKNQILKPLASVLILALLLLSTPNTQAGQSEKSSYPKVFKGASTQLKLLAILMRVAFFKLANGDFSTVFLNAKLSDMDGLEVARRACKMVEGRPPIAQVSGYPLP